MIRRAAEMLDFPRDSFEYTVFAFDMFLLNRSKLLRVFEFGPILVQTDGMPKTHMITAINETVFKAQPMRTRDHGHDAFRCSQSSLITLGGAVTAA
jgi:hypothetical protein